MQFAPLATPAVAAARVLEFASLSLSLGFAPPLSKAVLFSLLFLLLLFSSFFFFFVFFLLLFFLLFFFFFFFFFFYLTEHPLELCQSLLVFSHVAPLLCNISKRCGNLRMFCGFVDFGFYFYLKSESKSERSEIE
jgi:hypothetical protein